MALIVHKYGGTSMGSTERIAQVAKRVAKWARAGHQMVVVPSAMSGETNRLLGLAKELAPKQAAHNDAIRLNPKLYARIKALYDKRNSLKLDAESAYLVERYHKDFVRAGAQLSEADKAKLKAMNTQLAALQTQFSQNVLKEVNASAFVVDTREELAGLSDAEINAAAAQLYSDQAADVDIIITTALIPGRPAPRLITEEMVASMTKCLVDSQENPRELYRLGLESVPFLLAVGDLLLGWLLLAQAEIALNALDGEATAIARPDVPPGQIRGLSASFVFANLPPLLGTLSWGWDVVDTRAGP